MGMHIMLSTLEGNSHCLEVEDSWCVSDLKRRVEKLMNVEKGEVSLSLEGEVLTNDAEEISEIGLLSDDVIEVGKSHEAVAKRDLFRRGIECTEKSLVLSAKYGSLEVVQLLLSSGIDVDCGSAVDESSLQRTALMTAAHECRYDIVEALLKSGADITLRDAAGETALTLGVESPDITRLLLKHGIDVNCKDWYGMTALMYAIVNSNLETTQILLDYGAHINDKDNDGITPLMHAVESGRVEDVAFALSKGALPDEEDNNGVTALMRAAKASSLAITRLLLKQNVDVNATSVTGKTALTHAVSENTCNIKVVQLLLDQGCGPNTKECFTGTTPLMHAVQRGHIETVECLAKAGSDVTARDIVCRKTPLMFASPFYYDAMRCALGLAES
eukprot:TRINITY_DN36845_c0_g1_i1.p1 TRINITY_DN36845_c0_g1~~TRINITY_DN36845_c0_g1_i1.p1  ORF type:complete len:388 (+),score=89.96 TRINITY_DN36845_c0_g1_i1:37-1200(+)